ncbi:bleomycin resistance protein [Sphingomicrobium marinum]|uniref:bleomycin resistance protein n=1 Tax=Sphingomicrobium marinum TaxID=1227950 RepID=UPI00223F208D|nr:bleomycin resistance protein [Sphingomicrobium marinum]
MDHATPNLPSTSFEATSRFYLSLGFEESWRDEGWMILNRGGIALEFFPYPDLKAAESNFSCCLRLDDMDAMYKACKEAGLPEQCWGWPRLHPPQREDSGLTIAYMVDPDGSLIRLIQN